MLLMLLMCRYSCSGIGAVVKGTLIRAKHGRHHIGWCSGRGGRSRSGTTVKRIRARAGARVTRQCWNCGIHGHAARTRLGLQVPHGFDGHGESTKIILKRGPTLVQSERLQRPMVTHSSIAVAFLQRYSKIVNSTPISNSNCSQAHQSS